MTENDILAGLIVILGIAVIALIKITIFLAIIWAVWNWIVVPTLPYIAHVFGV